MFKSNLPINDSLDAANKTKQYFDSLYGTISYPVEQIDAVVGFFRDKGFDVMSSNSVSMIILEQAKNTQTPVFQLLDTLKGLDNIQLSSLISQVLNFNREKTSVLGYRQVDDSTNLDKRNIIV